MLFGYNNIFSSVVLDSLRIGEMGYVKNISSKLPKSTEKIAFSPCACELIFKRGKNAGSYSLQDQSHVSLSF